ncbi:hypothetical protein D3C72_2326160 [compost metagenome]
MRGHGRSAGDVLHQVLVLLTHDALQLVERGVVHGGDFGFGELAEDQVHFADAAVPAAEQNAPAARIEFCTAEDQTGHMQTPSC